jgi:glycosyltransferase involved in cell wall biosynthesis
MLRIGMDVSAVKRQRSGVGEYTAHLLAHLLRLGEDLEIRGLSTGLGAMDTQALAKLARWRHIRLPTRLMYAAWSMAGRPRADRLLGGADIYHATNYFLPPVAKARRVLTIYDVAFLKRPELCSPKIVGPFSRAVKHFAGEADAILTCSEASKRDIAECCRVDENRIDVAYGAADAAFAPWETARARALLAEKYGIEGPFLLFVSTLEPRKNIDGLLDAFTALLDHIPHTLVLVGGPGWKMSHLDARLSGPVLAKRIRRMGYVTPRSDLPAFYSAADAFVFPSHYEGFGLPVVEAMTCGCPVITSEASCLPEVAGGAALLVPPDQPEAIADAIRRVTDDKALRETLREKGRKRAAVFSWEKSARTVLNLYRRLA